MMECSKKAIINGVLVYEIKRVEKKTSKPFSNYTLGGGGTSLTSHLMSDISQTRNHVCVSLCVCARALAATTTPNDDVHLMYICFI